MNATVRNIHPEHLTLVRDREPWDLLARELQPEHHEPLQDIPSEEWVLGFMLDNPGRVTSLEREHFTGRDRPLIYELLRKPVAPTLDELDAVDQRLDYPGYINELRWQGAGLSKRAAMKDAVDQLRRLAELRALASAVEQWRREMPTMTARGARLRLAQLVFPRVAK